MGVLSTAVLMGANTQKEPLYVEIPVEDIFNYGKNLRKKSNYESDLEANIDLKLIVDPIKHNINSSEQLSYSIFGDTTNLSYIQHTDVYTFNFSSVDFWNPYIIPATSHDFNEIKKQIYFKNTGEFKPYANRVIEVYPPLNYVNSEKDDALNRDVIYFEKVRIGMLDIPVYATTNQQYQLTGNPQYRNKFGNIHAGNLRIDDELITASSYDKQDSTSQNQYRQFQEFLPQSHTFTLNYSLNNVEETGVAHIKWYEGDEEKNQDVPFKLFRFAQLFSGNWSYVDWDDPLTPEEEIFALFNEKKQFTKNIKYFKETEQLEFYLGSESRAGNYKYSYIPYVPRIIYLPSIAGTLAIVFQEKCNAKYMILHSMLEFTNQPA